LAKTYVDENLAFSVLLGCIEDLEEKKSEKKKILPSNK
jgi:hypothetical protein